MEKGSRLSSCDWRYSASVSPYSLFLLAASLVVSPARAEQTLLDTSASFSTAGQSIWGTGEAFIFNYAKFVGLDADPAPFEYGRGSGDTVTYPTLLGDYKVNPYLLFDAKAKLGIEVGASVNSGSMDAKLDYSVNLKAPDKIRVGEGFSLSGSASQLTSSGFTTSPANASAYIDGILEAYLGAYARVEYIRPGVLSDEDLRLGNKGFTKNDTANRPYQTLANINEREEIIGINREASGVVRYLGGDDLTDGDPLYDEVGAGSSVSLGPISLTAGNLNVIANGALVGDSLSGSGADTLATVTLDIDELLLGSPVLGQGIAHDWGAIDYDLGYDVLDVSAGLDINLQQSFTVASDLMVQLSFSDAVLIEGIGETNAYLGLFEHIPLITLLDPSVDVTATLLVDATLANETGLGFVGSLDTLFLEAHAEVGWDVAGNTGSRAYGLGPYYDSSIPVDLGDISVYEDSFALTGFNVVDGFSFTLTAVPIPAAIWLFGSGLLGVLAIGACNRSAVRPPADGGTSGVGASPGSLA